MREKMICQHCGREGKDFHFLVLVDYSGGNKGWLFEMTLCDDCTNKLLSQLEEFASNWRHELARRDKHGKM